MLWDILGLLGRLGAGMEIAFELKGNADDEKFRLRAKVIHSTLVGVFNRLGCRFTFPLRPSVLATILRAMRGP